MADSEETSTLGFIIGFVVSVLASIMYAAGLNLLKADHVKNSALPKEKQRVDCCRPLWHVGLYLYVFSQAVGSAIALNFLKTQWVAPLGSISLIFNYIFARLFVGTQIIKQDIIGTIIVLIAVCWIVYFGGQNNSNEESSLTLKSLKQLITQTLFIIYFSIFNSITILLFIGGLYCDLILLKEKRKERSGFFKTIESARLKILCGMVMATVAGCFASQTLLLAKSGENLFLVSIATQVNQFIDSTGWFIIVFLLITAILQLFCLNEALKLCDSVLVMPIFLGLYTTMGLINTMVYLDKFSSYPTWALILVFVGIIALIYGVILLSHIKDDVPASDTEDDNSIHGRDDDDDDKSLSGVSSWSDDSLFDKKKNKKWMGGVKGLFKNNNSSNIQKEKIAKISGFRKFGVKELNGEKNKSIFVGFKGFKGFKGFYQNGSVKSDGYNSEYNSYYSSENNSKFSIGVNSNSDNNSDIDLDNAFNDPIVKKEWSGDLGSIINIDKLITESVIGRKITAENVEKGGFAV